MEKAVLILSDTQLVTGLAFVIGGYSQLNCRIAAYRWQIMIYVAWFSSFSFLSAMAFLREYFQTNRSLRFIRILLMFIMASLLIVGLLPTGSHNWLNLLSREGGFYPSLEAKCYYEQMRTKNYHIPVFAGFTSVRALFDILESRLMEIIWLSFAISWGTVKLWSTRSAVTHDVRGSNVGANQDVLEEDFWSFGQILPLVLLLLPVLAMAQTYFDNDAKSVDAAHRAQRTEGAETSMAASSKSFAVQRTSQETQRAHSYEPSNLDFASTRMAENASSQQQPSVLGASSSTQVASNPTLPDGSHSRQCLCGPLRRVPLPEYPYAPFTRYPWYNDQIVLLILQIVQLAVFHLYLLALVGNFLGLSVFVHNRLFLIWTFAVIPAASLLHLSIWYIAAWISSAFDIKRWLSGRKYDNEPKKIPLQDVEDRQRERFAEMQQSEAAKTARMIYLILRMALVAGLLVFTFFASVEFAGPNEIDFDTD
ncbi:hypothetical protein M011DRAFT_476226 [Sporormia fimetaria CBS 119925]|uniref:Uncharacterized protein n=1 Tax=Sporormia fimetaria CBS 119925 TaxID=1340428 RepID=A0A6A6VGC3_9PLEO|nr:hypothetical protein M011DRAFT_476226 [Sporormia fimetaria CBS 119925]